MIDLKFCGLCGGAVDFKMPPGEDRDRHVCRDCGYIHYQNPRVIVGCLATEGDQVLLCKRAIEPRKGYWTLPAGFMENGETTAQGAAREMREEAEAVAVDPELYRVFDVPHISQVYVFYRCTIRDGAHEPGPESLETALFSFEEIPWQELAFPVVRELLKEYIVDRSTQTFPVRHSVIDVPLKYRS